MNRLERLYRIHEILRTARHPVTMRRFCAELGSNRNTVTRDFQYLKDMFGAPIIYDRERNGHCYDPDAPVFELPGLWMNPSELHALLACEQLLESVQPGLMAPRLAPLKSRIRQLLSEAGQAQESVADRVRVQAIQSRRVDAAVFSVVADAVLARRQLQFAYQARHDGAGSQRRVDPQQLLHYRHNWYLLAHCQKAGDLRLFSLDRIRDVQRLDSLAANSSADALDQFVNASFGIFSGAAQAVAELRFSQRAARWVAEEQWHPQQRGEWRGDSYYLWVPYSNPTELVMDILRHGPDVEVIAPQELRRMVGERLAQASRTYCP